MSVNEIRTYCRAYNLTLTATNLYFTITDIRGRLLLSSDNWHDVIDFVRGR